MSDDTNIEKLQTELAVMTATAKRALADLANYKRRAEEERGDIMVFANMRLLQVIFPVIDNLARAFDTVPKELQSNEWLKGVQAIEKSLLTALQNLGLTAVDETGIPVDANKHEVIMEVEGPKEQVMQILEKGYTFNNKTIRAAKVAVGKGS